MLSILGLINKVSLVVGGWTTFIGTFKTFWLLKFVGVCFLGRTSLFLTSLKSLKSGVENFFSGTADAFPLPESAWLFGFKGLGGGMGVVTYFPYWVLQWLGRKYCGRSVVKFFLRLPSSSSASSSVATPTKFKDDGRPCALPWRYSSSWYLHIHFVYLYEILNGTILPGCVRLLQKIRARCPMVRMFRWIFNKGFISLANQQIGLVIHFWFTAVHHVPMVAY